jgi:hypothetical protein
MNYHWYYFSWFRDLSRSSNMINRFVLCMLAFSFKLSCQKLYTSLKRLLVIELLFLKASIILRKYIYLDDCSICYNNKFLLPVATHGHDASLYRNFIRKLAKYEIFLWKYTRFFPNANCKELRFLANKLRFQKIDQSLTTRPTAIWLLRCAGELVRVHVNFPAGHVRSSTKVRAARHVRSRHLHTYMQRYSAQKCTYMLCLLLI